MQNSLDATDKPAKRGKKPERKNDKEGQSSKVSTPKKRKSKQAAPTASKTQRTKKNAHKMKAPSPSSSDSDYVPSDPPPEPESSEDDVSQHESSSRGNSPPPSPTHEGNRKSPPTSPTQSVPITIAPFPPPISSSTTTSIPIPIPLFIGVSTTTTTPNEPHVHVNVADTGAPTTESEPPITSKPLSLPPSHGSDTSDDDDDDPVTKRHLKDLNDKLDQLLSSSSTSSNAYSEAAIKALLATFVKEHDTSITNVVKAIDASTSTCQKASIAAAQKNAQRVNASVENLTRSLQAEKKHFEETRKAIQTANTELHTSVDYRLTQLEAEIAVENKIMDELDHRTAHL
ncbi:hypothetical protein Lser_V15G33732 [Lactuca serriola]